MAIPRIKTGRPNPYIVEPHHNNRYTYNVFYMVFIFGNAPTLMFVESKNNER
jgi:hypothetical protein